MDWPRYRKLCDEPRAFTRWMLEQTLEIIALPALGDALCGVAIAKPADHKGKSATDVFRLDLLPDESDEILMAVREAVTAGETTSGTRQRGLGGFEAAWLEYHEWNIQQQGQSAMSAEDRVMAMIDGFNRIDLEAILGCFADDAVYHNMPVDPVQGLDAIGEVLKGFMGMASEVQWDMLNIVSSGGTVLTERVDKFKVNGTWIELPVMGTFIVEDDRITVWRDYFDMNQFQSQAQAAMA